MWKKRNGLKENKLIISYLDDLVTSLCNFFSEGNTSNRINRFMDKTGGKVSLPDQPEEEIRISKELFFEDMDQVYMIFQNSLTHVQKQESKLIKEFAQERAWLRDELEHNKQNVRDQSHQI